MINHLLLIFIQLYYRVLKATVRFEVVGYEEGPLPELESGLSPVFAAAHNCLLPCILSYRRGGVTMLVSRSSDGELIASVLEKNGHNVVRGSSNRGAVAALSKMIDASKASPLAIAFDGPKGPPLKPKAGVAVCAQAASGSLFFIYAKPVKNIFGLNLTLRLKSWDRFLLPFPFAKFLVTYEKIEANGEKNGEQWRGEILRNLERRAQEIHGELYLSIL